MNQLPALRKNNFIKKIINKIKNFFHKEKKLENHLEENISNFRNDIKSTVNSQILSLKARLESGEIKAIDLTDLQIDELQKIYDEEIRIKQQVLNTLRKRVIIPASFSYKLATSSVVISATAANY